MKRSPNYNCYYKWAIPVVSTAAVFFMTTTCVIYMVVLDATPKDNRELIMGSILAATTGNDAIIIPPVMMKQGKKGIGHWNAFNMKANNNNNDNINNDKDKISELVEEQTRAWVALVDRQQQEEKQLNNEHIDQQCNIFEQLLVEAQKQRKKLIDQRLNKETEQLKANQAKQSVEDTKRLLAEKNFRNKQERDRRVRELNSNNMKKFIEERKRLANKHSQETSLLLKISKEEQEALKEENTKAKELSMCLNDELTFVQTPSSVC